MSKPIISTIETLLLEDGIELPQTQESERRINCISETHYQDQHESLSVDTLESTYHCYACGFRGNAYTYLTQVREWDVAKACRRLKEFGWTDERIEHARLEHDEFEHHETGQPKFYQEIPEMLVEGRLTSSHEYHDMDGTLVFMVGGYVNKSGKVKRIAFTPRKEGGVWKCDPGNLTIPEYRKDPVPLYRVSEMQERIKEGATKVLVLENEMAVDMLYDACKKAKVRIACTSAWHTRDNLADNDMNPLFGEKLVIVASTDPKSCAWAELIGRYTHMHGSAVNYVLPKGEGGYGITDALVAGGWHQAREWIKKVDYTHPNEKEAGHEMDLEDTQYFRVLGANGNYVVFQLKQTCEVINIAKSSLGSETTLNAIAPVSWWQKVMKSEKGMGDRNQKLCMQSSLVQAAMNKGVFNPDTSALGRGAAKTDSLGYIYNLGDKLMLEGKGKTLEITRELEEAQGDGIFVPGQSISISDNDKAAEYGREFVRSVMSYRWKSKEDGMAFIGWLVSGLVGGALRHRPMLWLQAPAGTGKTWLLEHVVYPLMGDCLHELSDVTEAALARLVVHDSLPVYIDEFEPKEGPAGRQSFSSVLSLLRIASGGRGQRVRSDTSNSKGTSQFRPRFSALLASINKPNLSVADNSRFYMLEFNRRGVDDWGKVRDSIRNATRRSKMHAVRSYIIRNTPAIARLTESLEPEIDSDTTREAQITAALSAGYTFLSGVRTVLTVQSKASQIDADEYHILNTMLSTIVMTDTGERHSIIECLYRSFFGAYDENFDRWVRKPLDKKMATFASREGFKLQTLDDDGNELKKPFLLVATPLPSMNDLLKGTEYSNVNLRNHLMHLKGAKHTYTACGHRKRVYIAGSQRYVIQLPPDALEACGFFPDNVPERSEIDDRNEELE